MAEIYFVLGHKFILTLFGSYPKLCELFVKLLEWFEKDIKYGSQVDAHLVGEGP